ncbi:Actin-related protein 4 [Candida viswanathii]|uniref:Actin-related protein 4 n=1 Tax=Candida viswanathii TaxID=5486 RepID=A0A367XNG8_9ASCO|nr:Actin-related protein 4 [Candida viswanathii]
MATTVYGGDEINAIILDAGSYTTRIGYAGDDFPKVIASSYYGELQGDDNDNNKKIFGEAINVPRPNLEIKPLLKESLIVDWDAALELYQYYFDQLKITQPDQPILVTEPIWGDSSYREKLVENFFEKFDFAGLYLAKSPTCVSFQQGRPNCLVVDIGHDSVSVTPVIDGICLLKSSMKTKYGGRFLSNEIQDYLEHKEVVVEPSFKIKSKTPTKYPDPAKFETKDISTTQSFVDYQKQKIYHQFKEILEVPEKNATKESPRLFELPTGQSIVFDRFKIADSIFDPAVYKFHDEKLAFPPCNGKIDIDQANEYRPLKRVRKDDSNQSTPAPEVDIRGLTQLITHTLSTIDIDLRASLANNIIVTGGVSLVSQLTDRLYLELSNNNPGLKIRLHAVGNSSERINQAWIGGSVLASLGTFHQMWVTKEEYKEAGVDRILNQRFR